MMYDRFEVESVSLYYVISAIAFCSLIWFLHIFEKSLCPALRYKNSSFNKAVLARCDILRESYVPTLLWGKSGHIQTIIYSTVGRVGSKTPKALLRECAVADDGTPITFDIFEPANKCGSSSLDGHSTHRCTITLIICPGIGNNSESVYIRSFVSYCLQHGYRAIVLNHVGSIPNVRLAARRIYTYGHTCDLDVVVQYAIKNYKHTSLLVAVGFSMGANLLLKYLGEKSCRQSYFACAVSVCQGYDIYKCRTYINSLKNGRLIYNRIMTKRQKRVIKNHWKEIYPLAKSNCVNWSYYDEAPYIKGNRSRGDILNTKIPDVDEDKVQSSRTLEELDENFSRLINGFASLADYYKWASSRYYMNKVKIPVLLLNAADDPLIPEELYESALLLSDISDRAILAVTQCGGHLGFFEGGIILPETTTWMDRAIVQYVDAVVDILVKQSHKHQY